MDCYVHFRAGLRWHLSPNDQIEVWDGSQEIARIPGSFLIHFLGCLLTGPDTWQLASRSPSGDRFISRPRLLRPTHKNGSRR